MKKLNLIVALFSVLNIINLSSALSAQADEANVRDPAVAVKLLITLKVGPTPATHQIPVANCGNDISDVMLRVSNAGVTVTSLGVQYTDRAVRQFTVNKSYAAGTESPWISLGVFRAMDSRCVASVFAVGQSTGDVAKVEVFGNTK